MVSDMQEIPIYLFTGFMDSGKTTLIKETLFENGFAEEGKSLIICCEDGDVEYDEAELKKINAELVMIEKEEEFTAERLAQINAEHMPDQIFLEYNGLQHYFEVKTAREFEIVELLDTLFTI